MKIAFVSDGVCPWNVGGIETIEYTEAASLAKTHEVHFFSLRWPGMKKNFIYKGIHYHAYHKTRKSKFYRHGRRSIREAIAFSLGIFNIFGYRFDVMEVNLFPVLHIPILKLYCKLTGCKLILDVAEVWDKNYWVRYLGAFAGNAAYIYATLFLKSADFYIANCSDTAERLIERGVSKNMIGVFSPIIDDKRLKRINSTKKKRQIVFSGRLIKEKRLDKFIEVVKKVKERTGDVNAKIIGSGPERAKISRQIKRNGLAGTVALAPFYSERKKDALYREIKGSSVFLHMSEREGLSIMALESLALGTPVVLPSYSPIPKDVKEMCVVANERLLPSRIKNILNSRDASAFIKNKEMLRRFYISNVENFYSGIFGNLGLGNMV